MTRSEQSAFSVPLSARGHRDRIERDRDALLARLARLPLRRFRVAMRAASASRADAFGVGLVRDEWSRIGAASRWPVLARVLVELAQARRVDLATAALVGRVGDLGTSHELVVRAEFVAFLDVAAEAAGIRATEMDGKRRDRGTFGPPPECPSAARCAPTIDEPTREASAPAPAPARDVEREGAP